MNTQLIVGVLNAVLVLLATLVVLGFQVHTYRKTRHRSTLILIAGSLLAVACYVMMYLPWLAPRPLYTATPFLLLLWGVFFVQVIVNVWGSAELFAAFRRLFGAAARDLRPADAQGNAEPALAASVTPPPRTDPSTPARGPWLSDVLRLWRLAPLRGDPGAAPDAVVAGLALTALALWTTLNRWHIGAGAEFISWNIPALGLYVLVPLGFAYLAARLSTPRASLRSLVFAAASLLPLIALLASFLEAHASHRAANPVRIALWLYVSMYLFVALRRVTGRWQPRAGGVLILLLGGFFAWGENTYWSANLWMAPDKDEAESASLRRDVAALLFDQRTKIDETVAAMTVESTPAPKVFFVGFAGVSWQRVFAEEIRFAAQRLAERFGSGQRQLLLVNDRRDSDTYAIADTTSLAYGLKAVARRMDPARDILVLSLSSHGGPDPVLSVANGVLNLDQLTGETLAKALAESGIQRRIIIISACHGGAFIPALRNPRTIIITAAAADKTSFGCADDRDLTYFGEAFYRDALPRAQSLESAFEDAKRAIAKREAREKQTPSDPQAYLGAELAPLLTPSGGLLRPAPPAINAGK